MSRPEQPTFHPLLTAALALVISISLVVVLYYARGVLIPLAFAAILLYLVDALNDFWFRIVPARLHPSPILATTLSVLVLLAAVAGFVLLVADSANDVRAAAPQYQIRFEALYEKKIEPLLARIPNLETDDLAKGVNVGVVVSWLASSLASVFGTASLVVMFLFFLLLDRRFYARKMLILFPDEGRRRHADELMETISHDVRKYLGVKTFVSLLTALPSYGIMKLVGLDFAAFWAVIIFIFNFVPNVGSLVATLLPAALALVQFERLAPILTIGVGITTVQLFVANLIEPNLMSKALNMSAFVVVFSLVAFGLLWGLPGVFLCVPLTTMLILVCARFRTTRAIAILLSRDGQVGEAVE